MACTAPSEGAMEDDSEEFGEVAQWDDVMAAKLLLSLSLAKAPVLSTSKPPQPPPELRWKTKGSRSRTITQEGKRAAEKEEEEATRASPTTPLSWSGDGSGTSGSVCFGGPLQGQKRSSGLGKGKKRKGCPESTAREKRIRALTVEEPKVEPHQNGELAPAVPGTTTSSASDKVVAVAAAGAREPPASCLVERVKPVRLRCTPEVAASVAVGRPGKKKTLAELQATRLALLQEQEGLRKELEREKMAFNVLLEENTRLRKLESGLSSPTESRPTSMHAPAEESSQDVQSESQKPKEGGGEEERPGEPHCTVPRCMFLFDLNCLPDDFDDL